MQYLSSWGHNRCVFDIATGIGIYSRQGIDGDKVMENIYLLIGHKHDKEIYLIKRFVTCDYARELSHVCRYTRALDLT
jgi:hypothetical protein